MTIDIDALEAVLAKATQGEWLFDPDDPYMGEHDGWVFAGPVGIIEAQSDFDASAIVALHNAAPALIAEHRALLARVEELEGAAERACRLWGQKVDDEYSGDWEDVADDMHNALVAALASKP